jgi:septal ring factor EnvC (AmiA/AmiB activator)
LTPNTRTLKGQSYCSQRWANPVWPKGSKSRGFSRRFQQEQQRINNQRLHEINERNRIALERENARRRAEEKRKAEQKRKETSRTNTNVPPSQPKNNRWSIGSNPTLLPRATSSKTATTKTNSSNKTDGKEGK